MRSHCPISGRLYELSRHSICQYVAELAKVLTGPEHSFRESVDTSMSSQTLIVGASKMALEA